MNDDRLSDELLENRVLGEMLHGAKVVSLTGDEFTSEERKTIYLLLKKGESAAVNHQNYLIADLRKLDPIPKGEEMRKAVNELKRLALARQLYSRLERLQNGLHKMHEFRLLKLLEAVAEEPKSDR